MAPGLVALPGVGADTAGQLLVTAGDNPHRLHTEAAFARRCGAAPIPASSGRTDRHRLHRGGDRDANSAFWRITLVRMRCHQPIKDYVTRRTAEGKTKTEIMRCLIALHRPRSLHPPRQRASDASIIAVTDSWPMALRTALRRGQLVVAEVPASRPDRRAWIAIYPLQTPAAATTDQRFNLFHREFEASYIDNGWCVGPGDGMTDVQTAHAQDEIELNQVLTAWGIDPSQLTYAHRTDYPVSHRARTWGK